MSHIARSSLIIAFFFGIDKVLSLGRQFLMARQFGLTYELDVFNAANNIPDFLSALISGGALGVALIPVLSEYLQVQNRKAAWRLFSQVLNLAFVTTGTLALVILIFAKPLVERVIVPGFSPEQQALTMELMRLDLVAIMIFSLSGLVMAGLQANQHFILPALAPVLYDVGQLVGVLVLVPEEGYRLGPLTLPAFNLGVYGLVYGVIFGALLHLLIQVPGLVKYRFTWSPSLGLRDAGLRKVLRLLLPRIATMFFIQMFFVIRDNLASNLGEGAITALNYGWLVMQVPETLIGTAMAIAILPTLAELFAQGNLDGFRDTVNRAVRVLVALTIPSAVLLAIGIGPVLQVLGFDEAGTQMVLAATRGYLAGLVGHSLLEISARSLYARQKAVPQLLAAMLNAFLYIIFSSWFSRLWGPMGIALANSLVFTIEALLLFWVLSRMVPGIFHIRSTLIRVSAGTVLGALAVAGLSGVLPLAEWRTLVQVGAGAGILGAGLLVVLPFIWQEIKVLVRL